jgi:Family of unknown function (DUF6603)
VSEQGTLQRIAYHVVGAVRPLEVAFADADAFRALLLQLGWDAPGLPPSYLAVADTVTQAVDALGALTEGAEIDEILAVVEKAGAVYRAIDAIDEAPAGIDPAVFLPELARRLFEYLLARQLQTEAPGWYATAEALGIIVPEDHPPDSGRPGFTRIRFDWDQIPEILRNPGLIPERVYGWGTPDLNFPKIAELLGEVFTGLGLLTSLDRLDPEVARALQAEATGRPAKEPGIGVTVAFFDLVVGETVEDVGILFAELPAEGTDLPGIVVMPEVPDGIAATFEVDESWTFKLKAGTDLAQQLGVVVRPGGVRVRFPGAPGQPLPSAGFGFAFRYQPATPAALFGRPEGTRLELAAAELGGAIELKAGDLEVKAFATVEGFALVLVPSEVDSFLGAALGESELRIEVPMGLAWSSRTGLDFMAGAGFEISLYPHMDAGVLRFDRIDIAVAFKAGGGEPPQLQVRAATSFSGELGPIAYSVDRLGVQLPIRFAEGNAGPFDIQLAPLWPTGLGMVIEAGPVTGGGFVGFDPENGRYVGILQLDVFEIGIAAIAILDTKDPAGNDLPPPGFSFIAIVAVELPPIQLGYGFTLNGVGGLAGVNRRLDTPALLNGVRTGAVDSILFPSDPIRDAPIIISNLSAIFPIAVGRHVFGPMAIIGWGTPTLISLELAIVLEVPAPITLALLGTASIRLPEDVEVVSLNIDVVGVLDFGRSLLAVDSSLRDSYVAAFAIGGDMAMRLSFGSDPNFALAVGGLHPHFDPPPRFPVLRRVSLSLGAGDNPRIGIEGYLAVTSNSFQFGAKAELYAEAGGFSVKGWLGFDALFIREPFSFRIDFSAAVGLYRGSSRIAGVTVEGTLTGPNPFHVWGKASLSLLFFDVIVPFDRTFGSRRTDPALSPLDPWPPLAAAIELAENWSAETQPGVNVGVRVRPPEKIPGLLLLHPMGVATLRQKVVPLNRTLEKFGAYAISGPDRFEVKDVLVGDTSAGSWDTVNDHFPPGEFEELSESEQVSRDSFEDMVAGVRVGAATVDAPMPEIKTAPLEYETRIIDAPWRTRPLPRFQLDRVVQLAGVRLGSAGVPGSGRTRFARDDGRVGAVTLGPELYAVATTGTLAAVPDLAAGVTKGAAHLAVKHAPAGAATGVQVVPAHELEQG